MGCLRRLGCLFVLVVAAVVDWKTHDIWRPWLPSWMPGHSPSYGREREAAGESAVWEPLTTEGAARAERAVAALGDRTAAVFTNVRPGDFASYMLLDLAGQLPSDLDSAQATVVGSQLLLRTSLDIKAMTGHDPPGVVTAVIGHRAPLTLAGMFDVVRPGVAEFRVQDLEVHGLPIPGLLIPQVVSRIENGPHPAGLASNALLVNVPPYVADIRATRSRITLYKNEP